MEDKKIAVTSRNGGIVFYQIPEEKIFRQFSDGETKMIDLSELKKLQYVGGGDAVIRECLIINDEDARRELNLNVEPEYFYTEAEVTKLLEEGTLDQLEDALNFAPYGVIELIQKIGVAIELPDHRKRKMIFEKTGFNIDGALTVAEILNAEDTEEEKKEESSTASRKAAPVVTTSTTTARKSSTPITVSTK